jgi:DNA-binding NtrC family response regulator
VIRALRLGAADFVTKPFENNELRAIVLRQLNTPPSGYLVGTASGKSSVGLLGDSPAFLKSLESARKAARTPSNVLITGESGTGKEGFARLIHEASARSSGPFIPVNCGALPESLIESELFGHVRGAFTGALADRPGKFVLADGGTLFLDEIGEMPHSMQVRLLRALQEHVVEPVGGGMPVRTDFRLIAATNRDLKEEVRAGRFREDLWFRLHVIPVQLPPLRERGHDIVILARHFLAVFNARYGTSLELTPENSRTLVAHGWPGNVRELANAMERAVVLSEGSSLMIELDTAHGGTQARVGALDHSVRGRRTAAEREVILAALEACRWNKTMAAERLGISRRGLLYKVKDYQIG